MVYASWIDFSLLLQLVFQKNDELFPNHLKILTICHITIWNTRRLCDNWRNIYWGLHQRVNISLVDTSTIRCQKFRGNFNEMVTIFWEPCRLQIKNYIQTLGKWHALLRTPGCVLWHLITQTTAIPPVGQFTQIFRVWRVLLWVFRTFPPILPRLFSEAIFTLPANQRWRLGHKFCIEDVNVKSHHCYFLCAYSKMTHCFGHKSPRKPLKYAPMAHRTPIFLYDLICK